MFRAQQQMVHPDISGNDATSKTLNAAWSEIRSDDHLRKAIEEYLTLSQGQHLLALETRATLEKQIRAGETRAKQLRIALRKCTKELRALEKEDATFRQSVEEFIRRQNECLLPGHRHEGDAYCLRDLAGNENAWVLISNGNTPLWFTIESDMRPLRGSVNLRIPEKLRWRIEGNKADSQEYVLGSLRPDEAFQQYLIRKRNSGEMGEARDMLPLLSSFAPEIRVGWMLVLLWETNQVWYCFPGIIKKVVITTRD